MEALVRWQHPELGLLAPANFITLAEETGLIHPIGDWVLREACNQTHAWQARFGRELMINVNLSPRQVAGPTLVQGVAAALADSGLAEQSLVLEITETVLMSDTETTSGKLDRLKKLGVRLAIDDFGTGYSSLDYLKRLPLDVIKVAKPFVDDVTKGREESALTDVLIRIGETFQLDTVAEGIEHPEQAERLRELGCPLGQGFHFARPVDALGAETLLRDGLAVEAR
jgi:EAL domain-containing protein (putative c-di-GMP-specific phosphodiesterase class I)